jgi:hypothetical protein
VAGGQQIDSGQGTVVASKGDVTTGSQATADAGTPANARLVRLFSRREGGGAASWAMTGSLVSIGPGICGPVCGQAATGQAVPLSAGSFGKSRTVALTGTASVMAQHNVGAFGTPGGGTLLPPKFAALQHDNATWLSNTTRRNIVANNYGFVMCAIPNGTASVPANLNAMRALNPSLLISQYCQVWEAGRAKGIFSITLVSGSTYLVTLDGTTEGASSNAAYGTNGATVQIRNCATAAFNGNWTMSNVGQTGGRPSFTLIGVSGSPANETSCTGSVIVTSDAHAGRVLAAQTGNYWLRGTVGGVANRIKSSGVDATQRAVVFHNTITPSDGSGLYFSRVKADYDFANLFTPYQPSGDPLMVWVDNWNYKQRQSGLWGATEGGPVGTTELSSTDTGVAQRNRIALKAYADRLRVNMPGCKIIGNADGVSGAAPAGIQSLTFAEWPSGTLDGAFIENLYGPNDTSPFEEDTGTIGSFFNDNGVKLQGRLRDQRSRLADPGLHVVMVRGRGADNATQQADYQFFIAGLTATLMQGVTRAQSSWYAFGPRLHDVTNSFIRHDAMDVALGEPIDNEQTAARGWSGAPTAWVRYFEGGVVIWNASTTAALPILPEHLAGTAGSFAPHPPGTTYKRITGTTDPFNNGLAVTSSFTIPAKSGVILIRA